MLKFGISKHEKGLSRPAVLKTYTPEHGKDWEGTAVLEKAFLKHEMLKKVAVIVTEQEKNIFLSITNLFLPHISHENYREL